MVTFSRAAISYKERNITMALVTWEDLGEQAQE